MQTQHASYLLPLADIMCNPESITIAERCGAMNKALRYIREHKIFLFLPAMAPDAGMKIKEWAAK